MEHAMRPLAVLLKHREGGNVDRGGGRRVLARRRGLREALGRMGGTRRVRRVAAGNGGQDPLRFVIVQPLEEQCLMGRRLGEEIREMLRRDAGRRPRLALAEFC